MSAALALPYVWAETARELPQDNGIAFYRRRTEELLRRYVVVSLQTGRLPLAVGNCVVRGKSSHYRMRSFEDAIIFLFDIEKCLKRLAPMEQELIARIAMQEYTQEETAGLMRASVRTVMRKYPQALDKLSQMFLDYELMEY
ncbi:sigma factor-like helix-turn-helix DNA-binding protein [Pseudacidobacterium ailaaui]|jgi:predicted DNA-binding protein (UPF0251 family)|uniref:sigma factor-like helix-turn-helix DNA-binding protein n=1 Tax=Pseudacidobacterium ailaaui TaxID=1382359 RepID=UPI00047BF13C|nr:sigma factor-like helix-turn-helix DNA-binding protein [Pseudacidobacterium ailaaui]MBX6360569.1 hypothetical protein [Pseudacidobacterium ailaaui]MCL6463286.1 hypothetical protein [Pseudacidobacterium ailaaui]MDI3255330.1 sigma factor-like helix-turn-helix DNA-binding protein [Bacillota bacterium]